MISSLSETVQKESIYYGNKAIHWSMGDLQPISAAEQASFCVELAKQLNMQRKHDHLCDVTLVTKDDKEFRAHRNVLSAASPFFHKLLQSDMKENREGIVRFEEISGSVMEDVLQFIYTGSVEITQENSKDLIATANYLLIPGLKTVSGRFLEGQMIKSNCISTLYFAEKYQCDELIANSRKFIHANFASVAEMDEFLNLEAKEVERWISSDEISVPDEADVFRIILKLVSDAIKLSSCSSESDLPRPPRKGIETRAIVACGGKNTFCYLPEKDEWKRLPNGLSEDRNCKTQMINFRDQLYTFHYGKAERFDPVFNGWSSLDLSAPSAVVTVVKGEIYAIEVDTSTKKSTIKLYNVELCSWQTVLSSHKGCRQDSCVVAAGNHLYVFGGKQPQTREYVAKAERFDTVENKWEEITDMQQARGCAFGVATQGKIFVAGGKDRERYMSKTCEMYSISRNEWQLIASLNVNREWGSMVSLKGTLYVLGGTWSFSRNDLSVECYDDATEDKWIKKTTIPVKSISKDNDDTFTGCALKLSKGVLDKAYVVKLKE
ncbi:hypothetical protein ACROYT_G043383 [Oculina patagonica]